LAMMEVLEEVVVVLGTTATATAAAHPE
jgi:hypothetical protein